MCAYLLKKINDPESNEEDHPRMKGKEINSKVTKSLVIHSCRLILKLRIVCKCYLGIRTFPPRTFPPGLFPPDEKLYIS